jgi:hypothetical protein
LEDTNTIGSIPNRLSDPNLMGKYLLKLTMQFIRVLHVSRIPNLKLVGSSICIEADILHAIEILQTLHTGILQEKAGIQKTLLGARSEQAENIRLAFFLKGGQSFV